MWQRPLCTRIQPSVLCINIKSPLPSQLELTRANITLRILVSHSSEPDVLWIVSVAEPQLRSLVENLFHLLDDDGFPVW